MKDPNILFEDITEQLTSSGQLFETREYKNSKGIALKEYASFPDNLRGYFDFGLLHADKEFLIYDYERFLYKDVIAKAAQVGNALISEGIEKGDRVAICMQNNPEFIFAYMGITGIGAVCVPLNSWWVPDEVIYALEHSEAKLLFGDQKRLQGLENLKDVKKIITSYTPDDNFISFSEFIKDQSSEWPDIEISRDDQATIYYTSGSTGKPKGVLSSQRGVISSMFTAIVLTRILADTVYENNSNLKVEKLNI